MRVKFGNGTKDVGILEVTPENYIVPEGEKGTYHCRIEQTQFNQRTGKRLSVPVIQKFEPKMWPMLKRNLKQQGWDIEVLYDPTAWLKQQAEALEQAKALNAKNKAEAAAKAREAEKQALKAEIIAELKAAGMLKAPTKGNGKGKNDNKEPKDGGSTEK